jgi:hypothetical protein
MYHANQREAASEVEMYFRDGKRHVILTAQMQSGKTGTFHNLVHRMHTSEMVRYSVLLCGMSDTQLYEQARDDALEYNEPLVDSGRVVVRYLQHFKNFNLPRTTRDILLILDESDRDSKVGSKLDHLLARAGIPINGNSDILEERNIYIVSVSATPFAEYSDVVHKNSNAKPIVHLRPGTEYTGIKNNIERGNILPIFNIRENAREFKAIVNGDADADTDADTFPKYSILRYDTRSYSFEMFERFASENNWGLFVVRGNFDNHPDENRYRLDDMNAILSTRPQRPTLILIHGTFRAGIVLSDKRYIRMVWENSQNPKTDTIVQGLVGRVCGYHNNSHIKTFVSETLLDRADDGLNELDRFLHFHNDAPDTNRDAERSERIEESSTSTSANKTHQVMFPDSFQHSKKIRKTLRNTTPVMRLPRELVEKYKLNHINAQNNNTIRSNAMKAVRDFVARPEFKSYPDITPEQHEEIEDVTTRDITVEDNGHFHPETLRSLMTIRNTQKSNGDGDDQYKDAIMPIQRSLLKSFPARTDQGIVKRDGETVDLPIVLFRVSEEYSKELQVEEVYDQDRRDGMSRTKDQRGQCCVYYLFFRTTSKSIYTPSDTNGKEIYRYEHLEDEMNSSGGSASASGAASAIYHGNPSMGITFGNITLSTTHQVIEHLEHLVRLYLNKPESDSPVQMKFTGELFNPDIRCSDTLRNSKEFKQVIRSLEKAYTVTIKINFQRGRKRSDGTRGIKKIEIN